MKLKRFITGSFHRIRAVFTGPRTPKRNYFRKSGQPCFPETLTECVNENGLVAIGDSYRRTHLGWTAGSMLETPPGTTTSFSSFRKRRQFLADTIKADFASGNLVQIQGWILARAEAEQCAWLSAKPSS